MDMFVAAFVAEALVVTIAIIALTAYFTGRME